MKNMKPILIEKIRQTSERGQAIILVAFAIVGLVAIVGLMIDGGMLLIEYARLKRGIDAASIAAASQFRKNFVGADLVKAGEEFLKLNQSDADVIIYTCSCPPDEPGCLTSGWHLDDSLCPEPGFSPRKLVRITATRRVEFGFIRIVGIDETTITATSVGEAASIDMVLLIDTSASMAYETTVGGNPSQSDAATSTTPGDNPAYCNDHMGDAARCEPMGEVKDAAEDFVDELFYPYDRVALIASTSQTAGGDRLPTQVPAGVSFMDNYTNAGVENTEIQDAIRGLRVFQPENCPSLTSLGGCLGFDSISGLYQGLDCTPLRETGNPTTCGSSNIGGGLFLAGDQFANARQDAFWVVIALIGGPANSTNPVNGYPNGLCPGSVGNPTWRWPTGESGYCRYKDSNPYNILTDRHWATIDDSDPDNPVLVYPADYDADDYARDGADYITSPTTGQYATIFSICMGSYCRNYPSLIDPLSAEHLGQYMALEAGDAPTAIPPVVANHGEYYHALTANDLAGSNGVFAKIAERIFTRISQ